MAYRFEGRFRAFESSLDDFADARRRDPADSFVLSGTSAKFSITFELAWKLMKDIAIEYYEVPDFVAGSPRETLRTAFRLGLIEDDQWMDMPKLRNQLAHDYNLTVITDAFHTIVTGYIPLFERFRATVRGLLNAPGGLRVLFLHDVMTSKVIGVIEFPKRETFGEIKRYFPDWEFLQNKVGRQIGE